MSATELLRAAGLRVTRPRLAVLDVLRAGGHLDVEEITARVRQRLDSVSVQAVYDILAALSRAGLARRIEPAGSPARYEAPCLDPVSTQGFVVDEAEVTYWGWCPTCRSSEG